MFYGGVIGAILAGLVFIRRKEMPLWVVADAAAPCVALGHAIGRIGCFLNGCCFGKPTDSWAGVVFGPGSAAWDYFEMKVGSGQVRVHPVQLYETLGEMVIFGLLLASESRKSFEGQLFVTYLFLYGVLRFGLEHLREGNPLLLLGLTGSQLISIIGVCISVALTIIILKRGEVGKKEADKP